MPARNAGRHVRRALTSTLRAMPSGSELLVYDDASDDGTAEIVEAVDDSRLRLVKGGRPIGVSGALNLLLDEARGDHVARMDADDVCLPWRFQLQRRAHARHGGILFGTVVYITERGLPIRPTLPTSVSPPAARL